MEDGKKHGHGVEIFASGDRFEGTFVNGVREGLGVCTFADGSSHEGYYVQGRRHGGGIFRHADGRAQVCHFIADDPKGEYEKRVKAQAALLRNL